MNSFTQILVFSIFPIIAMIIGGIISSYFVLGSKIRSTLLHFAAGVILAVVAVEILPGILNYEDIWVDAAGITSGFVLMLVIRYFSRKAEKKENISEQKSLPVLPMALLICIGVDILIDGLLIGIGFAAGEGAGLMLTVALTLEILVLGLTVGAELSKIKIPQKKSIFTIIVLSVFILVGSIIGALFLNVLVGKFLAFVLSFGLSALMYLITEELLVEAHEEKDSVFASGMFFVGFLIFLILGLME